MRRLIESGAVAGRNFVQVGLRGYWPPADVFEWMKAQGMRWHFMTEIEERGAEAVVDQAIAEALDGADAIYLSLDIDVLDPGMAPGTGTPEPGGMLTREVLRAVRRIVGSVELAAMDIVEVSPPYDHAEITAMAAHRAALEAISALAVKKQAGRAVRFEDAIRAATLAIPEAPTTIPPTAPAAAVR
jgi:agmatinase